MTDAGGPDPGWVLHEPGPDGRGHSGWLYHYADGTAVTDDGTVVETPGADPGWFYGEVAPGSGEEAWFYEYADGTVVDGDGEPHLLVDEVHAVPEPQPETQPETQPQPDTQPETEPAPPETQPETEPSPEPPDPGPTVEPPSVQESERGAGTGPEQGPPRAAVPQDAPTRRRFAPVAVLVLAAVVAAAVTGILVGRRWEGGPTPAAERAAARFDPPDAVAPDSEYVLARVLPSGGLAVDHWIRSSRPLTRLGLRVPRSAQDTTRGVTARGIEVETTAGRQPGPRSVGRGAARYAFSSSPTLHVSYVLAGTARRSVTVPRRAVLVVTSLDLVLPGARLPRTVVVTGARIRAAACSAQQSVAPPRPCGNAEGRRWRVSLEPAVRGDRVVAQVDLP